MPQNQYASPSWLTTSQSNTQWNRAQNIWLAHLRQTMALQLIEQQQNTLDTQSNGTLKIGKSTHSCQGIWVKPFWDSSMKFHTKRKTHLTHMSSQTTEPKHKSQNQRKTSPPSEKKKQLLSKHLRGPSSISGWQQDTHGTQFTCHQMSEANSKNNCKNYAIVRLSCNTKGSNNEIKCKWHDTSSPQWHWICKWEKGIKLHRRTFLSVEQQHFCPQQWGNIDSQDNHLIRNVFSGRSRIGSIIFECKRGGIHTTSTHRIGPPSTMHPHPNQQHNSKGSHK